MSRIKKLAENYTTSSNLWTLNFIEEINDTNIINNLPKEYKDVYKSLQNDAVIGHFYVIDEAGMYFKVLPDVPSAIGALMEYSLTLK